MYHRYIYPVGFPVVPQFNTVSTVLSLLATQHSTSRTCYLLLKVRLRPPHCCCPVLLLYGSRLKPGCHDRDIRSPCTLLSDRVHAFAVRLLYVLPFPFLSICPVSPPIGERVARSVSLYDYLICFLSCFRLLYVPVPLHY